MPIESPEQLDVSLGKAAAYINRMEQLVNTNPVNPQLYQNYYQQLEREIQDIRGYVRENYPGEQALLMGCGEQKKDIEILSQEHRAAVQRNQEYRLSPAQVASKLDEKLQELNPSYFGDFRVVDRPPHFAAEAKPLKALLAGVYGVVHNVAPDAWLAEEGAPQRPANLLAALAQREDAAMLPANRPLVPPPQLAPRPQPLAPQQQPVVRIVPEKFRLNQEAIVAFEVNNAIGAIWGQIPKKAPLADIPNESADARQTREAAAEATYQEAQEEFVEKYNTLLSTLIDQQIANEPNNEAKGNLEAQRANQQIVEIKGLEDNLEGDAKARTLLIKTQDQVVHNVYCGPKSLEVNGSANMVPAVFAVMALAANTKIQRDLESANAMEAGEPRDNALRKVASDRLVRLTGSNLTTEHLYNAGLALANQGLVPMFPPDKLNEPGFVEGFVNKLSPEQQQQLKNVMESDKLSDQKRETLSNSPLYQSVSRAILQMQLNEAENDEEEEDQEEQHDHLPLPPP